MAVNFYKAQFHMKPIDCNYRPSSTLMNKNKSQQKNHDNMHHHSTQDVSKHFYFFENEKNNTLKTSTDLASKRKAKRQRQAITKLHKEHNEINRIETSSTDLTRLALAAIGISTLMYYGSASPYALSIICPILTTGALLLA